MDELTNLFLLSAAASGSLPKVKACLEAARTDVNFVHHIGTSSSTALSNACHGGHVDVVKLLLREGASLVLRSSDYGLSPLHVAAGEGHTEVVEVLVRHGATVDIIGGLYRVTPLAVACNYGHVDTVRRLIEFGARVDTVMEYCEEFRLPGKRGRDRKQEACLKLMRDALETKQLRCCNPKCNKPGYKSDLKKCAACKLTRYCSRECQRQHWSGGHKTCCGKDEVMWT